MTVINDIGDTEPSTPETWREALVSHALACSGLTARDDAYADLVAPRSVETDLMRSEMLGMSGCALVVRGLWRTLGVQHPILAKPYVVEHAISDVMQIAKDKGALRPRDAWHLVELGDVVVLDLQRDDTHVYTVTEVLHDEDGDIEITSVDGGQRSGSGAEAIETIIRILDPAFVDHRQTLPTRSRVVSAIIDADKLAPSP